MFAQHIEIVDEIIQTILPAEMGRIFDFNRIPSTISSLPNAASNPPLAFFL
jgi:hypothetical protein